MEYSQCGFYKHSPRRSEFQRSHDSGKWVSDGAQTLGRDSWDHICVQPGKGLWRMVLVQGASTHESGRSGHELSIGPSVEKIWSVLAWYRWRELRDPH